VNDALDNAMSNTDTADSDDDVMTTFFYPRTIFRLVHVYKGPKMNNELYYSLLRDGVAPSSKTYAGAIGGWIKSHPNTLMATLYLVLIGTYIMYGFSKWSTPPKKKVVPKEHHEKVEAVRTKNQRPRKYVAIFSVILSIPLMALVFYILWSSYKHSPSIFAEGKTNKVWNTSLLGALIAKGAFLVAAWLGFFIFPAYTFWTEGKTPMFMGGYEPVSGKARIADNVGQIMLAVLFIAGTVAATLSMMEHNRIAKIFESHGSIESMSTEIKDQLLGYLQGASSQQGQTIEVTWIAVGIATFASIASIMTIWDKNAALAVAYSI